MDVYEEIAQFFNEPVEEVKAECAQGYFRLNKLWKEANPLTEGERALWYRNTDAHIYEGANWHNMHLEIRKRIAEEAHGKILCFGAGIGTEGIIAAEMEKEVAFYELQSLILNFLKFRVNLRNLKNVKFIDKELIKKEKNSRIYYEGDDFDTYDTIICIDVLEHLEHPQEVLNFLGKHLSPDGLFLVSSPFSEWEYLGHLPQNRYLDIDLMMKKANIKNYKKNVLSGNYKIGTPASLAKIMLLNIISILPISNSLLEHRIIYLLTSLQREIKNGLRKIGIRRSCKLYLCLEKLFFKLGLIKLKNSQKLYFGYGSRILLGWTNIDIYSGDFRLDILKGLPFKNNSIDFIYHAHFIEHFDVEQNLRIFNECYRVLNENGVLRILFPDLIKHCQIYLNNDLETLTLYKDKGVIVFEPEKFKYSPLTEWFNKGFYDFGHSFIYDFKTIEAIAKKVGFTKIYLVEYGQSSFKDLIGIDYYPNSDKLFSIVEIRK